MVPVLQSLVLAERIYEDKTGRKIIAGTFNRLKIRKQRKPVETTNADGKKSVIVKGGVPGTPYAYISLTDVIDKTSIDLQFVSLSRNEVIFETRIEITCNDRLATVEIVAALPRLPLHGPGIYAFELVCAGELIGSHRIVAELVDDNDDGEEERENEQ